MRLMNADEGSGSGVPDQEMPGPFFAPEIEVPAPMAIRLAGARLYEFAKTNNISSDEPLLSMVLFGPPDEVRALARDQRLVRFWLTQVSRE